MPRNAQNPSLAQSKRNSNEFDASDDVELEVDHEELAFLTASQGRSPVSLSSDDMAYQ